MNNTVLGGILVAGQSALRAPLYMAWNVVNYLGYLPANVEATFESAIQTPNQIPGLVSNLVYGLVSPDAKVGLFGQLLDDAVDPFTWLPKPIGQSTDPKAGLANETRDAVADAVKGILSVLPKPVQPSAAQSPPANLPTGTSTAFGEDAVMALAKSVEKPVEMPSKSTALNVRSLLNPRADVKAQAKADQDEKTADTKNADTKVPQGKAKHRKDESIKNRVTRAMTRGDHTKVGNAKPAKAAAGKSSGKGKAA
jgi:hypothetical protein